jgi:pre-mRNA-splicing factor ATP-dependent RNA helicase DHX38/PRP16
MSDLSDMADKGGLFRRAGKERHSFASGGGSSKLGLDKLAAEKRAEAGMPPPLAVAAAKRPRLAHLEEEEGAADDKSRQYRRPKPPTPSHGGGVNEAAVARIASRAKEGLRGDGLVFTTRGEGGEIKHVRGGATLEPPSPAHSTSDWEAPSPVHPSCCADGRAFASEPRAIAIETPLQSCGTSVSRSHISATPQPSPSPYVGSGRSGAPDAADAALARLHAARGGDGAAQGAGGEWEDDGGTGDAEADRKLDRAWYEQEEGGHAVDESHNPFLGDDKLFEKREEQMKQQQKRVNHRAQARMRDADRWEEDRLRASGMISMLEGMDDDDDMEQRTQVMPSHSNDTCYAMRCDAMLCYAR